MPMSASALAGEMVTKLADAGFVTNNEHAKTEAMCSALAQAVVEHLQANAQVTIDNGSSAGQYNIG
ncbi:hypothetical protein [Marinimicrobium sp. ARAG 43.8]|uniref:hypothetical protein n=1 Tax=Marinimicrobium sp. ARAG 43.8 TaxID=3418719 RepID=UPI003CF3EDFD